MQTDIEFMRRAIQLAMRGRGSVEPNPMVGCMIVRQGRTIGEGWHRTFGGPHAEPEALAACSTESPADATVYVTLEPCCHTNKKTPPCVPKLIDAKVARVVIGSIDPNPNVAGSGIAQLRAAGIRVDVGICEAEARQLVAPFIASVTLKRPYVTLKWAQTSDGKIAGPGGARLAISNDRSTRAVHQLRAASGAILVGINTVLKDDPMLTARGVERARPSARVVLDTDLRTPLHSRLVNSAGESPVQIFCRRHRDFASRAAALRARGVTVEVMDDDANRGESAPLSLSDVGKLLHDHGVTHLLIEPGPTLAKSYFDCRLADRLWVIRSPKGAPDETAPRAADIPPEFIATGTFDLEGDLLTEYLNSSSDVFFTAAPSADFVGAIQRRDRS